MKWVHTILLAVLVSPVFGQAPTDTNSVRATLDVPRVFNGEYAWRLGPGRWAPPSTVTLTIDRVEQTNTSVVFSGCDVYTYDDVSPTCKIKVNGKIDLPSHRLTMQESEASCTDGVTRGSYEGTISEDFQTIEAAWTTTGTSRKGDLYLTTGELKKLPWHNGGVVSNRFNDPSSPFRDYDKKIIKAVQKRWYSLIKKYSVYSHPGWVTVQFQITKEGKLEHVKILETSPEMKDDTFPKLFCEKAILEAGPFEPLPLNLRALAGEKPRDATFTFYY